MGLFGLGLALRRAAASLGEPRGFGHAVAEMVLGAVVLLFVSGAVSYAAKLVRRPSVIREELRTMPGRLGLSAFATCFYLLATTLSPYLPDLARGVFWAGLALHAGLIAGALGLLLVALYLVAYYRALGLVAVASLAVAALISYELFVILGRQLGFTLSLAGVAGAIVAIGITADSFIVYFERIRDEIREGRSLRQACAPFTSSSAKTHTARASC